MGQSLFSSWTSWGIWLAVALVGVGLLAWALLGDRKFRQRRCPRCFYDMSHSTGLKCSECGYAARNERKLHKRQRRWKYAMLGVAMMGPYVFGLVYARWGDRWWVRPVPTSILIDSMGWTGGPESVAYRELRSRMAGDHFSEEQWFALLERCLRGDDAAPPGSHAWEIKYGIIVNSWGERIQASPELIRQTLDLPARFEASQSGYAVQDGPACINLTMTTWWPEGTSARISVTPRDSEGRALAEPRHLVRRDGSVRQTAYPLSISPLPQDVGEIDLDITIEQMNPEWQPQWREIESQTVHVELNVLSALDDAMTPVTTEVAAALEPILREGISGRVYRLRDEGERRIRSAQFLRELFVPAFDDVAVGVRVEVLRNGEMMHTLYMWGEIGTTRARRGNQWTYSPDGRTFADAILNDGATWTMRVTGDPALALRVGGAKTFWNGFYELPVDIEEIDEPGWNEEWVDITPVADGGSARVDEM